MAVEVPKIAAQREAFVVAHDRYLSDLEPFAAYILAGNPISESSQQSFFSLLQEFQNHRTHYAEFRLAHPRAKEVSANSNSIAKRDASRTRRLRREKVLQARDRLQQQINMYVALSAATGDVFHDQDVNYDDLSIAADARASALFQTKDSEPIKFPAHERLNRPPEASPWKTPKSSGVTLRPAPDSGYEQTDSSCGALNRATSAAAANNSCAVPAQHTERPDCGKKSPPKDRPYRGKRQCFEPAHERYFMELMEQGTQMNYGEIAQRLNQRFGTHFEGKQCQQKWTRCLDPNISKGQWTVQEDKWLLALHRKHAGNFRAIAQEMIHRSTQQVQNRWKVLSRCH